MSPQAGWRSQRVKHLYQIIDDRAGVRRSPLLSVSIHYGVVPRDLITGDEPRADDLSNYKVCSKGDIVLNRMRAFQGAIGISGQSGLVSPDYLVLRPSRAVEARYLHHLFRSTWFVGEMISRLRGIGSTSLGNVRTPRINPDDLGDISIALPPLNEQRRIADFLDHETARIATLVIARTKQDELLAERFQDMVSSIADAFLARWGGSRLRFLLHALQQGWSPECEDRLAAEDEWGVVKAGCVNGGVFRPDQHKALPPGVPVRREYQLRPGDLLMCRASGSTDLIGSAGVVPALKRRLLLCDKTYRLHLDHRKVNVVFIAHMLRTRAVRDQIKLGVSGASGLANNLPSTVVKDLVIPTPPLDIQMQIVSTIQDASGKISKLRHLLTTQLAVLAERRQALTTAAVTGQMDVAVARDGTS